jgi:competence protein ComEC
MSFNLTEEIRKHPFIRITLSFIVGIILAINFKSILQFSLIITIISVAAFLVTYFVKRLQNSLIHGLFINLSFIAFGLLATSVMFSSNSGKQLNNYRGFIIGEISEDPKLSEKTTTLNLNITAVCNNNEWQSVTGKTILYIENDQRTDKLRVGDKIIFSPELSEIENKGNPEEFDYKKYLAYNLIYNSDYLSGNEWQLIDDDINTGIRKKLLRFRQDLINSLELQGITNDELAVISALALGYKDKLSDEIRHSYASSGAMHILAVSGLHVGIIYGILVFLLSFIKSNKFKIPKTVLIISFIWLYAMLTGLSPSVSRAALMFTILSLGNLQKHKGSSLNAIAFSAFILLLVNPMNITNIGFQLSYVAVIGIIIIYPKIYETLTFKKKMLDKIWSLTAVSIAAQIATAPLGLFYFHQFSNYFILANYLLIPLSTLAIWLCLIAFVVTGVGIGTAFIVKPLIWIVKSMNFVSISIESLPFAVSENIYLSGFQLIFLYLFIISICIFFFSSKKYKHLMIAMGSIIIFSATGLVRQFTNKDQQLFIVYNINKVSAVNIIDGRDNILFANLDSVSNDQISFSAKNNWLKKGLEQEKYINLSVGKESLLSSVSTIDNRAVFFKKKFIGFENLKVFIADENFYPNLYDYQNQTNVDFIILSNNSPAHLIDLDKAFVYKEIIIDSSNDNYIIDNWLLENDSVCLNIYNVKENGAFVFEL